MITPQTLGRRIKYFRKRAKFSQLDLELEAGLASGAISRIEKGRVNASKESVMKIARVLGMNHREVDYLIGVTAEPATKEDVQVAIGEVKQYFEQGKQLGYLVDDRSRLLYVSSSFIKLTEITSDELNKFYGMCVVDLILDENSPIRKYLSDDIEKLYAMYRRQIDIFRRENGFMVDDPSIKRTIELIMRNKLSRELWLFGLSTERYVADRRIPFVLRGKEVTMTYIREPLQTSTRFDMVIYTPTNWILNLVSKFI